MFCNHVPHNPPSPDGKYCAVIRVTFDEFDDAQRFLLNTIGDHADMASEAHAEERAETLEALRQDLNLESRPFETPLLDGISYGILNIENQPHISGLLHQRR